MKHVALIVPLVLSMIASAPASATPPAPGAGAPSAAVAAKRYPWARRHAGYAPLSGRFPPPAGFIRVSAASRSYAAWLRHLPLLPKGTPVRDYQGNRLTSSTAAAAAVIDLDVGRRDLQQCMDMVMRLRGEYLWWRGRPDQTKFRYAGRRYFGWSQWRRGIRPKRQGRRTVYVPQRRADASRVNFRRYLTFMFMMTGTMHNVYEPRVAFKDLAAGDFFVQPPPRPGYLGHAVVVLDVARNQAGDVRALLGEGYTPAQDLHVLKAPTGGVWFTLKPGHGVQTPLWPEPFKWTQFRRFKY